MNIPQFQKTFVKDGAVAAHRICTVGSTDLTAAQAAAATAPLIGVSNRLGAPDAADLRVDVILSGIVDIEAGDDVTLGGAATADSDGKAVDASAGDYAIGVFLEAGTTGDLVSVLLQPGQLAQAAA